MHRKTILELHNDLKNNKITPEELANSSLKHIKEVITNSGTIKYIMKDLDTDRLFEMSSTNYNKFLEINGK